MPPRSIVAAFRVPILKAKPLISPTFLEWVRSLRDEEKAWLKKHHLIECLNLFNVPIDWGMLRAAVTFWDIQLHVFRFQHVEVSPSLEDLAALLDLPLAGPIKFIQQQLGYFQLAEKLLGLTAEEIRALALDDELLICRERFQQRFMNTRPQTGCSEQCMQAFVFCLLEELFFPSDGRGFELKLLSILEAWKAGVTLVPYILAELYYALTQNSRGLDRCLLGCVPYLQIWLWERLQLVRPLRSRIFHMPHLLETILKAHCIPYQKYEAHEKNLDRFRLLTPASITWHSVWVKSDPYICDGRLRPLLLPHFSNVIAYYPFRFLRLFGFVQTKPNIQILKDAIWAHPRNNVKRISDRVIAAWADKKTAADLSIEQSTIPRTTLEYDEWILHPSEGVAHDKVEKGKGKEKLPEEPEIDVTAPSCPSTEKVPPVGPSRVDEPVAMPTKEATPSRKRPSSEFEGEAAKVIQSLWEQLQEREEELQEVKEHLKEVSEGAYELEGALKEAHDLRLKERRRAHEKTEQQMVALRVRHAEELAAMEAQYKRALEGEQRRHQALRQQHEEQSREFQWYKDRADCIVRFMGDRPPSSGAS